MDEERQRGEIVDLLKVLVANHWHEGAWGKLIIACAGGAAGGFIAGAILYVLGL